MIYRYYYYQVCQVQVQFIRSNYKKQITNLMFELAYKMRKTASHNKKQSIKLNADILK